MAQAQVLNVYMHDDLVGHLIRENTGAVQFEYSKGWLANDEARPISLSLGLEKKKYKGTEVYNFFDNLLPDNKDIRLQIAKNVQAGSGEAFDLLGAIGEDCVGALSFVLGERKPTKPKIDADPVTDEQIAARLSGLKSFPLGIEAEHDMGDFRISMAGAQEKTAYLYHNGQWKIPHGETPTTHIFKPPMGLLHNGIDLRTSVENEWLCLEICRQLGLPVCNAEIKSFAGSKCLVVERFDRKWEGKSKLARLLQEDFCQALGIASHLKYESDHKNSDGVRPGVQDILKLLNDSDNRAQDRYTFFKALVVFWLLGATDGHAKNFSLFITPTGFCMTPLYDVLSVYPALASGQIQMKQAKLAMAIGDNRKYKIKEIAARHFEQSARKFGIPQKKLEQIFAEIIELSEGLKDKINLPKDFPEEIFDTICDGFLKAVDQIRS